MRKGMRKFIADLELPAYKKCKYYNFYDALETFARDIFQRD